MSERGQLHRSRNAVLGGVCSGIADYLDLDAIVVRILFVAVVVVTLGVAVVPYVVLCVVLPVPATEQEPLDVEAQDAQSDVFGCLDARAMCDRKMRARTIAALRYSASAHMPPVPPALAGKRGRRAQDEGLPLTSQEPAENGWLRKHSNFVVIGALLAGSVLLTAAVSFVIESLIRGAAWWQSWPVLFVVLGFVRLAVPGRCDRRSAMFASGACLCALGLTLLPASVGVISWESFALMFERLWPLLLGYAGFLVAGIRAKNRAFIVVAACLFILFCILGLRLCALPGPMHEFVFVSPFGREYHIALSFPQVM